jgi:hypothetical protein
MPLVCMGGIVVCAGSFQKYVKWRMAPENSFL